MRHRDAGDGKGGRELVDPGVAEIAGDQTEQQAEGEADVAAAIASVTVLPTARITSASTGRPVAMEWPRSP